MKKNTGNSSYAVDSIQGNDNMGLGSIWSWTSTDYQLLQLIGTGSYGQVVQARHKGSGQLVAIKLIRHLFDD